MRNTADDASGAFEDVERLPGTERDGYVWPDYEERCIAHVPGTVGDLVVVPREVGVWFGTESRKLDFVGQHGGQHPEEMYVPLVATPLDAL